MAEYLFNVNDLVTKDKDGNLFMPYKISIRLVNSRVLRAIAKIEVANVVINDIMIFERYGRISIQFPEKEFTTNTGETRHTSVAFPSNPQRSREINRAIMKAYAEKCEEVYTQKASDIVA